MSLMRRVRRFFTRRTNGEYRELNRLLIKAGRRCAYDLRHAAAGNEAEWCQFYEERVHLWLGVFDPGDDGKNYRDRLHLDINNLVIKVEQYKRWFAEQGMADPVHDDSPF